MKHPQTEQDETQRAREYVLLSEVTDIIKNAFAEQMATQTNRCQVEQTINGNICSVVESDLKKQIKNLKRKKL